MDLQRFAVEFDRRTVGVAVRFAEGFMFFASDKKAQELDGRTFPRIRAIERHLRTLWQPRREARAAQRAPRQLSPART